MWVLGFLTLNCLTAQVEAVVALNIERGVEARRSLLRRLLPPALRDSEDTVHSAPPKARLAPPLGWGHRKRGCLRCIVAAFAGRAGMQQMSLALCFYKRMRLLHSCGFLLAGGL